MKLVFIVFVLSLSSMDTASFGASTLSLVISAAIPSIPSDGRQHPAFYLTVQDSTGKPYPLPYDVNVTIACSDLRILRVVNSVTISAAAYYVVINASSSVAQRSTVEVTVSASGFQSSKINAVVEPPAGTPSSLKVTLLPDVLLPQALEQAEVLVTVVDAYGKPTRARADIIVSLFSSNLQIGDIYGKTIVIPKGEFSAQTQVVCKGFPGTTTITASTSDLKSDSALLTVMGPKPEKIYMFAPSNQIVDEPGYLLVGIVDSSLNPVKVISSVTVNLYCSNISMFTVQDSVVIGAGEWMTFASLSCLNPGSATIYASAGELVSTSVSLTGVFSEGIASALKTYALARSFPAEADRIDYTAMIVQAVNSSGYPVRIPSSKYVDVFSSNSAVLETAPSVVIRAGSSMVNVSAWPKYSGSVKVSAMCPDLLSSDISFTVYAPTISSVKVMAPPIPSEGEVDACLLFQSGSMPAKAQDDIPITLSSSDTGIGYGSGSPLVPKKKYFAYFTIGGKAPGQFYLTASGSGVPSTRVQLQVNEVKPSSFSMSYVKPIVNYNFPLFVELLSSGGSSAAAYEPLTISLASSNVSNVVLPSTALIEAGGTETMVVGKALTKETATMTVSSAGFKSLTAQIAPAPINLLIKILASERYPSGESVAIKCSVTLEGEPVKSVPVYWKGVGLMYASTVTDSNGTCGNTLTVQDKDNVVDVGVDVGGMGYITARKVIIGFPGMYHLEVTANVQVDIKGSGNYSYGTTAAVTAPAAVPLPGFLGLLGGRYSFRQWTGVSSSTSNSVTVAMGGDSINMELRALYSEDYSGVMYTGVAIAVIAVAALVSVYFFRRRRKTQKPRESIYAGLRRPT